jgi:acyl-CoA dehydrogenase
MIDFSFPPEVEDIRLRVREFMDDEVRPVEERASTFGARDWIAAAVDLRGKARDRQLWLPHMPAEWGGMGLGPTAMAAVSAEAATTRTGPFILNCQAPDEGNQHTLLHWGTPDQKQRFLRPLCDGEVRSCFAMTEPEVAGADPAVLSTTAVQDGDEWVLNGHKWFVPGAEGAAFALVMARTDDDPDLPHAATTCFIVELPTPGWTIVASTPTVAGANPHSEIVLEDVRVPAENVLGGRGKGHLLGQYRLGPARLAHCMRWIGQAETALDLLVRRAMERPARGSLLAQQQGIQWMIADSTTELYQAKLMVLHAAYRIERNLEFRSELSMAKHFVSASLGRIVDRAIQVHGALGWSTDTELAQMLLQARWSRFADGAEELHQARIAERTIASMRDTGSTRRATGDLPL